MLKLGEYFDQVPSMPIPFIDEAVVKQALIGTIVLAGLAGIMPSLPVEEPPANKEKAS